MVGAAARTVRLRGESLVRNCTMQAARIQEVL
jgi:hypothetical protein